MNPVRALSRPLLASMFVTGGIDAIRRAPDLAPVAEPVVRRAVDAARAAVDSAPEATAPAVADAARSAADAAEDVVAGSDASPQAVRDAVHDAADEVRSTASRVARDGLPVPDDPVLLTRVNGAVMVGAGVLLGIGRLPRASAVALAATLIPTTLAAHRFWEVEDPGERRDQQVQFFKNMGLLGGLGLAAIDTEGRPGLAWRARHGASTARREARLARRVVTSEVGRRAGSVGNALPG